MARPLRIAYPGALYHVTSRDNEQQDVFKSHKDRERFLAYLESAVVRYGAVGHTWCLMRNHDHLLLETPSSNLSQIMRHINGAYTTSVHATRKRAGHLFQGRYQAILVEADQSCLEMSASTAVSNTAAHSSRTSESVSGSVTRQYLKQAGGWHSKPRLIRNCRSCSTG